MDIQVETLDDCRIVRLRGKITYECCPEFESRMDPVLKDPAREIVLDFREVPFIDSSGVGEILRIYKRTREGGGEVVLLNPNPKLRDLFSMYRFHQFMQIREESEMNPHA